MNYKALYNNSNLEENEIFIVDQYGFINTKLEEEVEDLRKYKLRWYQIIDLYKDDKKTFKKMILKKNLLQTGIPQNLRSEIWKFLLFRCKNNFFFDEKSKITKFFNFTVKNLYNKNKNYIKQNNKNRFNNLLNIKSSFEFQIHVDIQRTFRDHFLFKNEYGRGQSELFNVLYAFSTAHKSIGYCQGLNDITAILLIHYSEVQAFEILEYLIFSNKINGLFDKSLSLLPKIISLQKQVFYILVPKILLHIEKYCENYHMYLIEWYMTFFTRFKIKLVLRIWDLIMFYGFRIVFIISAAILRFHQERIFECKDENLITLLKNIKDMEIDENYVIDLIFQYLNLIDYKSIII